MGILSDQRGQMNNLMNGFMTALLGFILLGPILEILNAVISGVVGGNMSAFSNVATINLLLGLVGVIVVIMTFISVIQSFQQSPQQGGF